MLSKATLGGGCFWCIEACLKRLKGVERVIPGFAGGDFPQPKYAQVCSGKTGHAEVVQIDFNHSVISFVYSICLIFLKSL